MLGKILQVFFKKKTSNWALFCFVVLPDVAVCSDVCVEVGRMTECLVAVRTLVRGGGAVSRLVFLKVSFLPESLLADGTLEGTFS